MHELNVRNSDSFRFFVCKFSKLFANEQNLFEIMLQKSEFAHIGPRLLCLFGEGVYLLLLIGHNYSVPVLYSWSVASKLFCNNPAIRQKTTYINGKGTKKCCGGENGLSRGIVTGVLCERGYFSLNTNSSP